MKTIYWLYLCFGLGIAGYYEHREWNATVPDDEAVVVISPSVRVPTGGTGGSSFWYSGSRGGK